MHHHSKKENVTLKLLPSPLFDLRFMFVKKHGANGMSSGIRFIHYDRQICCASSMHRSQLLISVLSYPMYQPKQIHTVKIET